ncbi:MAG: protease inhibitor I42 family protein [Desulfobaccales bacterium]
MAKIMLSGFIWLLLTGLMLSPSTLLAAEAAITVTKAQSGQTIALKVGDIVQIELPTRGGTGYSWLVNTPGAPYLKLMSQTTRAVGETRPGSPVMQVWRFQAKEEGETEINLAYYRPWEGIGKARDHFRIKIRIQ